MMKKPTLDNLEVQDITFCSVNEHMKQINPFISSVFSVKSQLYWNVVTHILYSKCVTVFHVSHYLLTLLVSEHLRDCIDFKPLPWLSDKNTSEQLNVPSFSTLHKCLHFHSAPVGPSAHPALPIDVGRALIIQMRGRGRGLLRVDVTDKKWQLW